MNLNVNVARFDNNKLVAFGNGVNNATKSLVGIDAVLTPFQTQLVNCQNAVNNVLEKTKAKEVSAQLKKEDNIRDNCIIGLNKIVDAQTYNPDEEIQQAAKELDQLLAKLGNSIQKESYDKESALNKTLLVDLNGDYASQVAITHATPFVVELEASQTRFDNLRQKQLLENVEMTEIVSMSAIRREFENSIRALLTVLPAFFQISPTPELKQAIGLVQELINKFN